MNQPQEVLPQINSNDHEQQQQKQKRYPEQDHNHNDNEGTAIMKTEEDNGNAEVTGLELIESYVEELAKDENGSSVDDADDYDDYDDDDDNDNDNDDDDDDDDYSSTDNSCRSYGDESFHNKMDQYIEDELDRQLQEQLDEHIYKQECEYQQHEDEDEDEDQYEHQYEYEYEYEHEHENRRDYRHGDSYGGWLEAGDDDYHNEFMDDLISQQLDDAIDSDVKTCFIDIRAEVKRPPCTHDGNMNGTTVDDNGNGTTDHCSEDEHRIIHRSVDSHVGKEAKPEIDLELNELLETMSNNMNMNMTMDMTMNTADAKRDAVERGTGHAHTSNSSSRTNKPKSAATVQDIQESIQRAIDRYTCRDDI